MLIKLWLIILVYIQIFTKTHGKVCQGLGSAPGYSTSKNRSADLTKLFKGCKVILKNVEVIYLNQEIDPTFLDSIEEVHGFVFIQKTNLTVLSMKNLRLVRGKTLHKNQSIRIVGNQNLRQVIFPSLREVANGIVYFEKNINLCHVNSINWIDITYKQTAEFKDLPTECPQCKGDCSSCWNEDTCQKIWRTSCPAACPTGCVNGTSTCCGKECLGGCYDHPDKCVDCKLFSDGDICREHCPEDKYHYGFHCLEVCPSDTVHHLRSCLHTCPINHYVTETAKCMRCPLGEDCPKVCAVSSIDETNVTNLENCTTLDGPLFISNHLITFKGDSLVPLLERSLSKVKEITATAIIQGKHKDFTDIHFLRNLEIVKGKKSSTVITMMISFTNFKSLNLTKLRKIGSGELRITTNEFLESLDLISLTQVEGQIMIQSNKNLCYVDNTTFAGISDKVTVVNNKDPEECIRENKVCDVECKGGCWGPGNELCRFCRHFKFEGACVPSCDLNISFDAGEWLCKRCHSQCYGCFGEGPEKCTNCLNFKEDKTCVARCSDDHFVQQPTNRTCSICPSVCKNGCTGPATHLGEGGCNDCHLFLSAPGRCIDPHMDSCGDGFYMETLELEVSRPGGGKTFSRVKTCQQCHPLCRSCTGGGTTSEVCKCLHVDYHGHCQQGCPPVHYIDSRNTCQMCHTECDECFGPQDDMCHTCKHVRISLETNVTEQLGLTSSLKRGPESYRGDVVALSDPEQSFFISNFYCTSVCPPELPSEVSFKMGELVQRRCQTETESSSLLANVPQSTIGSLVVCGVGVVIVVVIVVVVMRRQKTVAELNKAKLEAHLKSMGGYDLEPIVTPTTVSPDLASIRLIKEFELERGETIGSGAFGTVYRGIWRPEDENIKVAVAIKILIEGSSSAQHKELLEEARVMASVNHPCCIRILAVCLSRQMMLVTPLVAHGSLLDYVRNNGLTIGSYTMLKWATQIARGMNYLEQKGIVHRDLAARNILVQGINQIKITDFGLAKLLTKEEGFLSTGGKVPVKWLALESIQHRIFTHKSDVWSYGVTLWELFTYGKRPYQDVSALHVSQHLENGERLPQPSICTIDVYTVLFKCWTVDAASRPTFHELEMEFENMSEDSKRFLIIQGDKLSRIPSDFVEDNRTELLRQMRLSDSDDFVCGEDYLDPVFSFPIRISSKRKTSFLAKVMEEEETSFQTFPEYTNSPRGSSFRPSLDHQSSNMSSSSIDRTFSHLVAATVALEGNRTRKISDRYLDYPNSQCTNKEPLKSTSSEEKDFLKLQKSPYYNSYVSKFMRNKPNVDSENYLEPMPQKGHAVFLENPEYMEEFSAGVEANNLTANISTKDLRKTTVSQKLTPLNNGSDYCNEFAEFDSNSVEGIAQNANCY